MKTIGCFSPFFKLFRALSKHEGDDERTNQRCVAMPSGERFGLDKLSPKVPSRRASPRPLNHDAHEPRHDNIGNAPTSKKAHRRFESVPEAQLYASEPWPVNVRRANSQPMTQRLKKVGRFINMSLGSPSGTAESDSQIDVLHQQYLDYKFSAPIELYQTINGLEPLIVKKVRGGDNILGPRAPLITVFSTACKSVYGKHLQPADKWSARDGKLKRFKKAIADFKDISQLDAERNDAGKLQTLWVAIKEFERDLQSDPEWRDYYKELDKFLKATKEFEKNMQFNVDWKGSTKLNEFVATIQDFESKFQPKPKWQAYYERLDEFKAAVKHFEKRAQSDLDRKDSGKLDNLMESVKNFESALQFDSKWGSYSELEKLLAGVRNFDNALQSDLEWRGYEGSFQATIRDFVKDMQSDPEWTNYIKLEKFRTDVQSFEKDLESDRDWKGYKNQYNQYLMTLEKRMLEVRAAQAQQSETSRASVNDRVLASSSSTQKRIVQQRSEPFASRITLTEDDRAYAEELKQYLLRQPLGPEMIQLIRSTSV
jgi:tetratricopeptide (TPR) repeat protein